MKTENTTKGKFRDFQLYGMYNSQLAHFDYVPSKNSPFTKGVHGYTSSPFTG